MKTVKLITVLILIISVTAIKAQDIPKKTNTIIVHGVTFNEVANQLLDKRLTIDKSDSSLQYIYTRQWQLKGFWNYNVTMYIRIKDSSAIITGTCSDAGQKLNASQFPIEYKGENVGMYKKTFNALNDFALSFNKPVEYLIQ